MRTDANKTAIEDVNLEIPVDWSLHKQILAFMDFMYFNPDIESLTQYLATSICPSGEICRVHVATLHNDGNFRTYSHFGYSTDCKVDDWEIPVTGDRPVIDAFRSGNIVLANADEIVGKYRDFKNIDPASPWGSSVIIPTKHPLIFGLRRQREVPARERVILKGYFEIVGKMLDFWQPQGRGNQGNLSSFCESNSRKFVEKRKGNLLGSPLTLRQKQIVSYIMEGMTNYQIAQKITFSESLVRQETVIIYAKLGVSGRRELSKTPESLNSQLLLA